MMKLTASSSLRCLGRGRLLPAESPCRFTSAALTHRGRIQKASVMISSLAAFEKRKKFCFSVFGFIFISERHLTLSRSHTAYDGWCFFVSSFGFSCIRTPLLHRDGDLWNSPVRSVPGRKTCPGALRRPTAKSQRTRSQTTDPASRFDFSTHMYLGEESCLIWRWIDCSLSRQGAYSMGGTEKRKTGIYRIIGRGGAWNYG